MTRCLAFMLIVLASGVAAAGAGERRVVAYFAEWEKLPAARIPAAKLTHVNYAFAVIRDGVCVTKNDAAARGHFAGLRELKRQHPHLKTLVAIGGWTDSGPFYDVARTAAARETFARSAARFAAEHGFDGVDIDWEYPGGGGHDKGKGGPEDTGNFTALLGDLRKSLDEQGKADGREYLLTIAAPAGGQAKRIELAKVHPLLDFLNLMTYDFAGEWSATTGLNAPLFTPTDAPTHARASGDVAVRAYLKAGVPARKIVLGVPFYGRAWGGVKAGDKHGLHQAHTKKPSRAAGSDGYSYRTLKKLDLDPGRSMKRFWHDEAKVPWLFDPTNGDLISYDDPQSIRAKAQYVKEHHLGGVMIWEISQDDDEGSLLAAVHEGLR